MDSSRDFSDAPVGVGSIIRAARRPLIPSLSSSGGENDPSKWPTCRAVVATVSEATASLIWEDMAPQPPASSWLDATEVGSKVAGTRRLKSKRLPSPFLVAPDLRSSTSQGEEEEDVPLSSLRPLLAFENDTRQSVDAKSPLDFKKEGDTLLRLRDYSAAVTRYESALLLTSSLELGGTVILNVSGRPTLAEVDCVEDTSVDVTYVDSGDEGTVDVMDVLLCLSDDGNDVKEEQQLQERILLNLSRCLLQLAYFDDTCDSARPTKYRKAAVLGCTLAISCASYGSKQAVGGVSATSAADQQQGTEEKARLIRAAAYLDLGKAKHAMADVRHVLKVNPNSRQAKQMSRDIERREVLKKKTDKKLAKEMCKWVQHATDSSANGGDPFL